MAHDRQELAQQSDEALESQIVSARAALRHDVMLLEEKVSPRAIVERRRRAVEHWLGIQGQRVREQWAEVVDSSHSIQADVGETMEHTMENTRSRVDSARERARVLPAQAMTSLRQSSYSRPLLFAGLAFAAGWGISRLVPITRTEEEVASRVAPVIGEKAAPLMEEAKTSISESAQEAFTHRQR